jgi:hypothetical protein
LALARRADVERHVLHEAAGATLIARFAVRKGAKQAEIAVAGIDRTRPEQADGAIPVRDETSALAEIGRRRIRPAARRRRGRLARRLEPVVQRISLLPLRSCVATTSLPLFCTAIQTFAALYW